jgi:hypothetical protein
MARDETRMPDVPTPDFVGAMCEIWFTVNYAAYHLAYTRVYLQTRAMQTHVDDLRLDEQAIKDQGQVDMIICRSHLASFFWELHHVFEAMEIAIKRGQKEQRKLRYFYTQEHALEKLRQTAIPKEIEAYRNESHNIPAIIGQKWEEKGGKFMYHFLPSIKGHEPKDSVELNKQLQVYFDYVVNLWLAFLPKNYKATFPRNFSFPVTVPFSFVGDLPADLQGDVRQLQVSLEAFDSSIPEVAEKQNGGEV